MAPLCELKNRAKRKISARKQEQRRNASSDDHKSENEATKPASLPVGPRQDLNLKRLKDDERFLDSLKESLGATKEQAKQSLGTFATSIDPNPARGGRKSAQSETAAYFPGMHKRKRLVDKSILNITNEVLEYIGGRKKFWSIQSSGMKEEEKAKVFQKGTQVGYPSHARSTTPRLRRRGRKIKPT